MKHNIRNTIEKLYDVCLDCCDFIDTKYAISCDKCPILILNNKIKEIDKKIKKYGK